MPSRHSVYSVNVLFLIVLFLQLLNFFLGWMPQYVRMILNEAFFVLLPALLYLRWAKLPLRQTVRLKSPGWQGALGSLLIGAGFYPVSVVLGAILQVVLKYPVTGAEALLPKTPLEGVLAIIAYAIMAPICEEIFARGIIQQAYERQFTPRKAIVFSGVLFIVFHLSFLQGLTIIPLSLALGYVYWRSGSLVASMLTHFGANAMAALVVSSPVFWQGAPATLLSPVSMGVGVILVIVGFWLIARSSKPIPIEPKVAPSRRLRQTWPLVIASILYLTAIGLELGVLTLPNQAHAPVTVGAVQDESLVESEYSIQNKAGAPIAEVVCRLEPAEEAMHWQWKSTHQAYDIQVAGGRYMGGDAAIQKEASWRQVDGTLLQGEVIAEYEHERFETRWSFDGERFLIHHLSSSGSEQTFELALANDEESFVIESSTWPWVLRTLPFSPNYVGTAYYFKPYTWRQETQDNGPVLEPVTVTVRGPETLEVPAGVLQAWKVTVGQTETAWYSADTPHVLLKYDSGIETMSLVGWGEQ